MSQIGPGVTATHRAVAPFLNRPGIILEPCLKDIYSEPLRVFRKQRSSAGYPRRHGAVEKIDAVLYYLEYILYLPNSQKMAWFLWWQKR